MLPGAFQQSPRATPHPCHSLALPASGIFPLKRWGSDTWLCCKFLDSNEFEPPLQAIDLLPHLLSRASAPRHGTKHFYSHCPSFSQKPEVGTALMPYGEAEAVLWQVRYLALDHHTTLGLSCAQELVQGSYHAAAPG